MSIYKNIEKIGFCNQKKYISLVFTTIELVKFFQRSIDNKLISDLYEPTLTISNWDSSTIFEEKHNLRRHESQIALVFEIGNQLYSKISKLFAGNENFDHTLFHTVKKELCSINQFYPVGKQFILKPLVPIQQLPTWLEDYIVNSINVIAEKLKHQRLIESVLFKIFSTALGKTNSDPEILGWYYFFTEHNPSERAIGDLFYTVYPNEYLYDCDSSTWYSINKYGIYKPEGKELLSGRSKIRDDLYSKFNICCEAYKAALGPGEQINHLIKFDACFKKKICSSSGRKGIIEDLKEKYKYNDFRVKSNNNKYIFAFENGVFDLRTNKFRNALPEELVTVTCGYNYNKPPADCINTLKQTISDIFPETELCDYVLTTIALKLVHINTLEEFYFWIGSGGNGKGLLTKICENTFGPHYSTTLGTESFMKNKHGVHAEAASPALASTHMARVLFVNELKTKMKLETDLIKKMSGNDKLKVRFLNENSFEFVPGYSVFFISNDDPEINTGEDAIIRRLRYIRFLSKFVDTPDPKDKFQKKINRGLKELIDTEKFKCAFFDILLSYYQKYLSNGNQKLVPPECVLKETNSFIHENDPVKNFVNDMLTITKNQNDRIPSSELYEAYMSYHDNQSKGYDKAKLKKRLETDFHVLSKRFKTGICYTGVTLKEIEEI